MATGPHDVDVNTPNAARIYDYLIGGKDNYLSDRVAAAKLVETEPHVKELAQRNRVFLERVVRFCVQHGVRQFLDLGSGLPTARNVHQVAQAETFGARVVYVDYDPVVATHGAALLASDPGVRMVQRDLRDPRSVVDSDEVRRHLDFAEPIAVLAIAVLHFVDEVADPAGITAVFRDAVPAGSFLVVSHATSDGWDDAEVRRVKRVYDESSTRFTFRTRRQVEALFDGWELVPPGLAWLTEWGAPKPPVRPERSRLYAAVGRKPD